MPASGGDPELVRSQAIHEQLVAGGFAAAQDAPESAAKSEMFVKPVPCRFMCRLWAGGSS